MFTIDSNLQNLRVKERSIFKILYSMNSHPVATPEMSVEEARCYILFFSEGQNLSSYIGLYLPHNDRKFFYAYTSNPFPFEAAADVEDEARQFAEDMGFLLDEINVGGMAVEDRNHWIEDQYIFGYKKPELPSSQEEEEEEAEEQEEPHEEGRSSEDKGSEAEEERGGGERTPVAPAEKEPETSEPLAAVPPVVPVLAPQPAPEIPAAAAPPQPPVMQPGQPPQPPGPYPPQPGQPYAPPQPYPAYPPQQGQPYAPPQPYPGYPQQPGQPYAPQAYPGYPPQPGQPYAPPQPYPGYPQPMPTQYPPVAPQPPELEVPELEEPELEEQELPAAPSRRESVPPKTIVKKKTPLPKAVPPVKRSPRADEEEDLPVEVEMESAASRTKVQKTEQVGRPTAARPAKPKALQTLHGPGPGETVTRDKEALARLLASF